MKSLTVRLLGPFQIWRDNEPVALEEWPTQKCKTLLKILLTERGRVVHRDRLIDLLWPDLAPDSASSSLHVAISQLRRLLEPHLERPDRSGFVLTHSSGYLFEAGADCWIDVDAFWEALERGQHWLQRRDWGPALASFRKAEDLYHGDYLEEDPYQEWTIAPRERLREAYLDALSNLAHCSARLGDHHKAIAACQKVLARDPLRESVYRQLMIYHYRLGQRDRALRAFERCRNALAETLGVDPMPQTREMHERILQERPVREIERRSPRTPRTGQTAEQRRPRPSVLPLVGRDEELRALDDHLAEAVAGRGRVVLVNGNAGVGKTRLVEALLTRARALSIQVWRSQCHEAEQDLPFQPVSEALRPYLLRRLTPEQAHGLLGPWAPQVALLLPEVRELVPAIPEPTPLPPQQARQQLLYGLVQFCLSLTKRYPLLLFFDDLQWADPSSLQFLHLAGQNIEKEPLLLIGAYRDAAVDNDHPLTAVVQPLLRQGRAVRLLLDNLSAQAVETLVTQKAAPGWDSAPFSRRLVAETEGNPLFLTELLQSLLEEGHLVEGETGRWQPGPGVNLADIALPLPETVQRVIQSRLQTVNEPAQRLLETAAVIGPSFSDELLERSSQLGTATLLDALDELLARRLIREAGELDNGEYAFSHDQIRMVVYQNLSRARRQHLHHQIATVLEAIYAGHREAIAARLARHYAAAGHDDKALHYFIVAGDRAARQYAQSEALAAYDQALESANWSSASREQLIHLYTSRGRVLELNAQYNEALANYQEMEKIAHGQGDRAAEFRALMAQLTVYATFTSLFDTAKAEELAGRAITLARHLDDKAAEARLLWNLSILYRNMMRLSRAVDYGERSLALSRQLGLREEIAFALHDLAAAYYFRGDLEQSVTAFQEVSALWRELDKLPMLADSLAGLSQVHSLTGKYDRALATGDKAFEISTAIGNHWGQANSRGGHIGFVHWERGRPDKALAVLDECVRLGEQVGSVASQVFARSVLGAVYGSLGASESGLTQARQALGLAENQLEFARHRVLGILAQLHLLNEDLPAAEAIIEQGRRGANEVESPFFLLWFRMAEAELALRQGDDQQALVIIDDYLAGLHETGARAFMPPALTIQGRALLAGGRVEAAEERLRSAQAEAAAIGSQRMLWQILAALAEVETRRGNAERAGRLRRQAQEITKHIADHAPTAVLRTSFLARPAVRALMNEG